MGMALHVQVYRTQGAAYFTVLSLRMAVTDIRITPPCLLRWKMTRDFLMKGCYGENGRGVCGCMGFASLGMLYFSDLEGEKELGLN